MPIYARSDTIVNHIPANDICELTWVGAPDFVRGFVPEFFQTQYSVQYFFFYFVHIFDVP